jgi:hypothetical protein
MNRALIARCATHELWRTSHELWRKTGVQVCKTGARINTYNDAYRLPCSRLHIAFPRQGGFETRPYTGRTSIRVLR